MTDRFEHRPAVPRHVGVVTFLYPTAGGAGRGRFVEQFVRAVARTGTQCTVIHPAALHERLRAAWTPNGRAVPAEEPEGIRVLRPLFVSLSDKKLGPLRTFQATDFFFSRAVGGVVRRMKESLDVLYGHFLYPAGAAVGRVGEKLGIPAAVAVGESDLKGAYPSLSRARVRRDLRRITAFVAVSEPRKRELVDELGVCPEKIGVFPNGVDLVRFRRHDRRAMRAKHGLPQDAFIVAFVGHFNERKGVLRVSKAVQGLAGVGAVYAGTGNLAPDPSQALFQGEIRHDRLPELLSAADVFVLPTLAEGCSNAILEAMACGLPIVSSDEEFNDGLLDPSMSIRVNPRDVRAIRGAIQFFRENEDFRRRAGDRALEKAKQFDVQNRAEKVLQWIADRTAARAEGRGLRHAIGASR